MQYVHFEKFSLNSANKSTITLFHPLQCNTVAVLKSALHEVVWMAALTASRDLNLHPK